MENTNTYTSQGAVWIGTFVYYGGGKMQCLNQTGISGVVRMRETQGSINSVAVSRVQESIGVLSQLYIQSTTFSQISYKLRGFSLNGLKDILLPLIYSSSMKRTQNSEFF